LVSAGEKYLRELVSETKSLELFCYKKPLNDKILDVRIGFIAVILSLYFLSNPPS